MNIMLSLCSFFCFFVRLSPKLSLLHFKRRLLRTHLVSELETAYLSFHSKVQSLIAPKVWNPLVTFG